MENKVEQLLSKGYSEKEIIKILSEEKIPKPIGVGELVVITDGEHAGTEGVVEDYTWDGYYWRDAGGEWVYEVELENEEIYEGIDVEKVSESSILSDDKQYRDFGKAKILEEQTEEEARRDGHAYSPQNIESRNEIQEMFEQYDEPYGAIINLRENDKVGLVPLRDFQPFYNFGVDIIAPDYDEELDTLLKNWVKESNSDILDKIHDRLEIIGGSWLLWD